MIVERAASVPCEIQLSLLGGFRVLTHESEIHVRTGTQRLLVFLALHTSWVRRTLVAGTLWPESSEARAYASLRSALSRVERPVRDAIQSTQIQLRLADGIIVDLARGRALAHRILVNGPVPESDMSAAAVDELSSDLLCDWYDDWALLEIEDWRQLRLHALEALAERLAAQRRFVDAARAALAAVKADALRESPHATLIRVHLAEGNRSEAIRELARYEKLLSAELGIAPSPGLRALVSGIERTQNSVTPR
jgi:DNA-binding SARP family transcriptional activator